MHTICRAAVLGAAAVLGLASAGSAAEVRMMTGPQAGFWVPLGGQLKDIWEKAVFYHFIHAIGLVIVPLLARVGLGTSAGSDRVCWLLAAGILIFSGTLYALSVTGIRALGAITPIGGTAFILGWLLLAWDLFRSK